MRLTREARKVAKGLLRIAVADGRVDGERVRALALQLIAEKPHQYIGILKEFHRLIRLELAKRHVVVESATELSPSEVESVTNDLKTKFGSDLTAEFKYNPELLGGLRIRVGSDVFDGTVKGRLELLEHRLATA
ncbi:MAG TPA: F0F1 ATP synthase subunit delta [Chthoniobacterales bacterium]